MHNNNAYEAHNPDGQFSLSNLRMPGPKSWWTVEVFLCNSYICSPMKVKSTCIIFV